MATISKRQTKSGIVYKAEIRLSHNGQLYRESKTFPKRVMAVDWARRREEELHKPGALDSVRTRGTTIRTLIEKYEAMFNDKDQWGRSKAHDLKRIKGYAIADLPAASVTSADLVAHIVERRKECGAATALNDLVWLRIAFKVARPAFNIDANLQAIDDARALCDAQKLTARPGQRNRRPTIDELNSILCWESEAPRSSIPYVDLYLFLLFSGRRDAEMCRIRWTDLDKKNKRVIVRDMKHPRQKIGNHVTVQLTDEAWAIVQRQAETDERIFPFEPRTVSSRFTRTCKMLCIDDLRLHDLRHECASWLGELGYSVPFMAQVTGHRNWNMLQRYTHVDHEHDKYSGWEWRPILSDS